MGAFLMNLQEFIDKRTHCPFCNTALVTQFISDRKQKIRLQDGRLLVVFVMKGLYVNQQDYEVGYSFSLEDETFRIEFFTEWDTSNYVPMHLIDKFKKFHDNLSSCKFKRTCTFCNRYTMSSTPFGLNFKTLQFDHSLPFGIMYEAYGFTMPIEDGFKIMHLSNFYFDLNKSNLTWFRSDTELPAQLNYPLPNNRSEMALPFIPFVSREETTKRLNNLIVFA
jgi:hypothetical protein